MSVEEVRREALATLEVLRDRAVISRDVYDLLTSAVDCQRQTLLLLAGYCDRDD